MRRIVVLDDYQGRAVEFGPWSSLGKDVVVDFVHERLKGADLVQRLVGAEVVVAMRERTRLDRELINSLQDLRLIVTTGSANVAIDAATARERGIVFSGTSGSGTSVPELAWALILAVTKHLPQEDRVIRSGGWQELLPVDLHGSTLALAGLGRLGGAMVPVARAFGMRPIAWSQNLDLERARSLGVEAVTKDLLLEQADVLSIHLRLSDRTRRLFGARELAHMKPSAVLVNTSRGAIVDEKALLVALRTGQIGGAGLDVFDEEPLPPGHPLTTLDNVVLAPHLGYVSEKSYAVYFTEVVEDIAAFYRGEPIRLVGQP